MARYDREFLVPYLSNICALHYAENKLWKWYYSVRNKRCDLLNEISNGKPNRPDYEQSFGCGSLALAVIAAFCAITGLVAMANKGGLAFGVIFCALAGLCTYCIIRSVKRINKSNDRMEEKYKAALNTYEIRSKNNSERIDKMDKQMEAYKQEIDRISALQERLYSVNIIPSRYRDAYAAVYLYDWFSTSRADDLDHALSMYVLEEIKSRLDTIIENQAQGLLNQQVMMANQMKSMEQRRQYEATMKAKLDRLQATSDERLCYAKMIESNTAALSFLATASYLSK